MYINTKLGKLLEYLDFFGTTFTFYAEGCRQLYTPLGGILTILSIIVSIFIFVYIKLEEFLYNNPNSTISTKRDNYRNIKFREEKIWVPWRIRDFGGKTINHKDFLYPIIFYYKGIRNQTSKKMEITYDLINYKLCNEITMVNYSNLYGIDIELDQLYCIDMEDLDIGGSWDADFLNLITLDLYVCKNGIEYDENNTDCTTYDEIMNLTGQNDSFEFEMYYPTVQYEPNNRTTPIFVKYYNYFYHFSRFSNKIDRLYLQQHILYNDMGLILKSEKKQSNWGCASLSGDSYTTGDKRDLMNEGSSSRLYSFNIYLRPETIVYKRNYKKIYLIVADALPIMNVIVIFFKMVTEFLKIASGNKKLTELLFENLKEDKIQINSHFKTLKIQNNDIIKKMNTTKNNLLVLSNNKKDNSYINLNEKNYIKNNNYFIKSIDNRKKSKISSKTNPKVNYTNIILNKLSDEIISNDNNSNFEENILNNKYKNNSINFKSKGILTKEHLQKNNQDHEGNKNDTENNIFNSKTKATYIKAKLFPYRYYLFSIFIKHIDISKNSIFFTKKFIYVYNFICRLLDISSYLIIQKEVEIIKNALLVDKYKELFENNRKININEPNFNFNIKECLNRKKLTILNNSNKNIN